MLLQYGFFFKFTIAIKMQKVNQCDLIIMHQYGKPKVCHIKMHFTAISDQASQKAYIQSVQWGFTYFKK